MAEDVPHRDAPRRAASDVLPALEALADRAGSVDDLRLHKLQLVAARTWRARGRLVPASLQEEERRSRMLALLAPLVLARVRQSVAGPIVVLKGPEAAARYPDPLLRPWGDLDLLVPDAHAVQRALLAAGFVEVGDPEPYVGIHHLRPIAYPGMPLPIEVHERPKWLDGFAPPPTGELIAGAVPSATGVDGVLALAPAPHALVLAAHSWAHTPLRRALELADVALVAADADEQEIRALASAWGVAPLWSLTSRTADALLGDGPRPFALRVWARNLPRAGERTVLESHVQRWLSPFGSLTFRAACVETLRRIGRDFRRRRGETWRQKAARTLRAVTSPFTPLSDHDRALERDREERP